MADVRFGVGVATTLFTDGLKQGINLLLKELQNVRKCKKEFESFKQELDHLSSFLNDLQPDIDRQNSEFIQKWQASLTKCLDDSRQLILPASNWRSCWNINSRRKLRKAILARKTELEGLRDNVIKTAEIKKAAKRLAKHSGAESSLQDQNEDLVGREKIIEDLEVILLNAQGPKIIALHGMAGAGKTSIVKKLIHRHKVVSHFGDNIIWDAIGKDSKLEDFKVKVENHISSVRQVSKLIVLDDVWEKREVRFVQEKSEYGRHRFIMTTRKSELIEEFSNIEPIPVQKLSESDSWKLFECHAFRFRNEEHKRSLEIMAKQVANKCKGLPLALKVIGQAMSGKKTVKEWKNALDRLQSQDPIDPDHEEHLIQVLRISYDALGSLEKYMNDIKLRECFLYFGAFEEDTHIHVESLLDCWAGEGLLEDDKNPQDQTYQVLGVLIGSSLIEKVPFMASNSEECFQIHDTLRDLALYISKHDRPHEDLFRGANNWQLNKIDHAKVLRISCNTKSSRIQMSTASPLPDFDLGLFEVVPHLKVLLLDGRLIPQAILDQCLSSLCSLQVLSLVGTDGFEYLPDSLGELQCLVALNLRGSKIKRLPHSLQKLTKLKLLNLERCEYLHNLPKEAFLDLKSLQVFKLDRLSPKNRHLPNTQGYFLREFSNDDATQFQNLIRLTWFSFVSAITQLPAFMENMLQLTILKMRCPITDLEPLRTLDKLEHLEVLESQLISLPDWICKYSFLSKLRIETENKMANYLPDMDDLSQLRNLRIKGWEKLTSFPKLPRFLKELCIEGCHFLERLGYLGVRRLDLKHCSLRFLKSWGPFLELQHLHILNCRDIFWLPEADAIPQVEQITIIMYCGWNILKIPMSWLAAGSLSKLQTLRATQSLIKFGGMIYEKAFQRLLVLELYVPVDCWPKIEYGALPNLTELHCTFANYNPGIRVVANYKPSSSLVANYKPRLSLDTIPDSFWRFLDALPPLDKLTLTGSTITSMEEWGSTRAPKQLTLRNMAIKRLPTSMLKKESPFQSLERLILSSMELELEEPPVVELTIY